MSNSYFFAGSTRQGSINHKLAEAAWAMAAERGHGAHIISLADYDMPIYNDDFEDRNGPPDAASAFDENGALISERPRKMLEPLIDKLAFTAQRLYS